jgi:hypothetical protein
MSLLEPVARQHGTVEGLQLEHISATTLVSRYTDQTGWTRAGIYDLQNGKWNLRSGSELRARPGREFVYRGGALHVVARRSLTAQSSV